MLNVPILQQLLNQVPPFSLRQILIVVIIASTAMFLMNSHKASIVLLLSQYTLLPQLLSKHLHQSIFLTRLGIGFSICLILYLTADHMQNLPLATESADQSRICPGRGKARNMGLAFRTLALMLGGFAAHRLWCRYPLPPMPPELTLASYWLMSGGLFVTLVSGNPLRMGFGLLSFINGFVALYLFWEPGFLVTGLLNVVDILFAVGIVLFAESWLDAPPAKARSKE